MKTGKADTRDEAEANPQPKAKTAKQMAAEQEKAARLLARETRQKESDDRFTSPRLIRAIVESFGKIAFDPCWHAASAVPPDHDRGLATGLQREPSSHIAWQDDAGRIAAAAAKIVAE